MVDGGFEPIAIPAGVGDTIVIDIRDGAGATTSVLLAVPRRRPPIVVRTYPAKGKRDVALNSKLVIVFSEPVASSTLTSSSVQLFRGTSAIAGTVSLLGGTATSAVFAPDVALQANTAYRLEVTWAVTDLDGDALEAGVTVEFRTGQSSTGPPASIRLLPDSVLNLVTGATYRLTATVRDAAGTMLTDQPVTWSTNDPNGLAISPTGLLTALGDGFYLVTASVGSVTKVLMVFVTAGPAASVAVTPTPATVAAGDTIILAAIVRDAAGRVIKRPSVTWTSNTSAVATVGATNIDTVGMVFGTVSGVSPGSVTISATSGTASGTLAVTVTPPQPVASVTVTASATLIVQGSTKLTATLRDANGRVISSRPITWTNDNTAVAIVDANGLVTGVSFGSASVTATSEGVSGTAAVTVTTLSFASVTAGFEHTCALTTSGAAFCWGANYAGQLGNDLPPEFIYPDDPDYWDEIYVGSFSPVAVNGGLTFSSVSAGGVHTCGLATNGAAHCWGWDGYYGQLGIGSNMAPDQCSFLPWMGPCARRPMAVAGGLTFAALDVGDWEYDSHHRHSCGITASGAAYCWGANFFGQLGIGSADGSTPHRVPAAVMGGLRFAALQLGTRHTCGLTPNGAAYCWGDNTIGQLGNGSSGASSPVPLAVTGGRTFAALSVGAWHSCGLTTGGVAYCWGSNYYGQLGNGSSAPPDPLSDFSTVPVAIAGLTFASLSGGGFHTCALTTGGAAYCWGLNRFGRLGIGSEPGPDQCLSGTSFSHPCSRRPLAVIGGLSFAALSAGGLHSCGLTTNGIAYCWGPAGPIGNGSRTNGSSVPVKVAGQP